MPHTHSLETIEAEIESLSHYISAMEDWAPIYGDTPELHSVIIQIETKLESNLRAYFRGLADRVSGYINWGNYLGQTPIKAYDVNVVVEDEALEAEVAIMMNAVYDPLQQGVITGAQAAEKLYKIPIGASAATEALQEASRKYIANLVKLNGETSLVVSTRNKIRQAIATGLARGFNQAQMTEEIQKIIKNPVRAATIARTEAVNAYSQGTIAYGSATNATKKAWVSSSGPCPICEENIRAGEIPFGDLFPSGHACPSCHPNDRCGLRLIHDYTQPVKIYE